MWKRLSLLWMLVKGDARRLWFAVRHPAAPGWLKLGINYMISLKALEAAKDVEALTGALRAEFVDGGGLANLRQVTADMTKLVAQLGSIAQAQSEELTRTQRQLRSTLAAVDSAVVDSTLRAFQASSANVAAITDELRHAQTQVRSVLEKLDNGTGTAGKLLNDPTLYARLDTLLLRLDSIAADVKANPRRYINLRVF